MKVAIIGAMEEEVTLLRSKIEQCQTFTRAGCEIYSGILAGVEVYLLRSGIGKVAAAMSTTILIEHAKPDLIINTGSAGGLSPSLNVGDIIVSDHVCYHDADLTAFGYKIGQMAGCPESFAADQKLITLAETTIHQLNLHAVQGLICSGDSFVNGKETLDRIRQQFPHAIAVEMEAAAIGHVCHNYQLPFVVVRAVSDVADKESHLSFDKFLAIAAKQSSQLVEAMLKAFAAQA